MSIYSLSSGESTPQFTPPPAVRETTVFEDWQNFLGGLAGAVKGTAQAIADTTAAVAEIRDETRTPDSPTPKEPGMSPILAIAIGVGLAFALKKLAS